MRHQGWGSEQSVTHRGIPAAPLDQQFSRPNFQTRSDSPDEAGWEPLATVTHLFEGGVSDIEVPEPMHCIFGHGEEVCCGNQEDVCFVHENGVDYLTGAAE